MEFNLTDIEFASLRRLVYQLTGIKLADGKRQMLRSRLSRRLRATNCASFREYQDLVESQSPNGPEVTEFINSVTTNKTDFYREPHHFEFVTHQVIPMTEKRLRPGSREIRIWHAGCSTGEEPYTMSIALHEALSHREPWLVKQLATDIDSNVLAHAARGEYDIDRIEPVPHPLRGKYFLKGKGDKSNVVRVKPILAEWLTFRQLNLLEAWPFGKNVRFDIIFCRNVMIYFDKPTQQNLVDRFGQMLNPGGHLLIGHSESLFGIADSFKCLGKTIYVRSEQEAMAA